MESRVEMHAAQITKMQKALEEADQEKARVEEDLEVALRAMQSFKSVDPSDQQVVGTSILQKQELLAWKSDLLACQTVFVCCKENGTEYGSKRLL